jgi:PAS domain S-box-containing protein
MQETDATMALSSESRLEWIRWIPTIAAVFSIVAGGSVLLGWALSVETLKRVLPGLVAMNPVTALCFIALGVSLWLRRTPAPATRARLIGQVAAWVVLAIAVARLATYVAGLDLALDRVLFSASLEQDSAGIPNRMAPNTATLFAVLAVALLLMDYTTKRRWRPTEWLALACASMALLATLGYFFGAGSLYRVQFFIPMAANTSAAFLVVAIGVLAARPHEGLISVITTNAAGGVMARRMMLGAIGITLVFSVARLQGEQLGLFDTQFGVALMTSLTIFMLVGYIWWIARALNNVDATRRGADLLLRAAHEQLREQHQLMKTILDSVGEGIAVCDTNERFIVFNPAAEALTGYGPAEGDSSHWQKHYGLFKPDKTTPYPTDEIALSMALRGESVDEQEQFLRNEHVPNGRFVSVSARPLRSAGGALRGGVVVFRDITERKHAEQRLRAFNSEMERCVEERTRELARTVAQLQQFAYVASHDLQEPLRMVTSYLQLIDRRYRNKLDDTAREFINFAVDGAARMKQLITDLLDYSRVESKAGTFRRIDTVSLLNDVMHMLEPLIEEAGAQITLSNLPVVVGDLSQLRQVFQNLLGNSLKFRGEGQPNIHVTAEPTGDGWAFVVRDNGIGLDPEHAERIFEMFQRLHGRESYPGTGIGLAICKKIVERHGGRIWVESEPGAGATFRFTLPTLEIKSDEQQVAA